MHDHIVADWNLNYYCNFRCPYCFLGDEERGSEQYRGRDVEEIARAFDRTGIRWLIHMSGGEPFLHPEFVRLCRLLTIRHRISVNTNLATSVVARFADEVDPGRVEFVHASLHLTERERMGLGLEAFARRIQLLRDRGFEVFATQVMLPEVVERFAGVFERLRSFGVTLRPKVLKRRWRGARYPKSYTRKERREILSFIERIRGLDGESGPRHGRFATDVEADFVGGELSFKGLPCAAGRDMVSIAHDGSVRRCVGDREPLGHLFQGDLRLRTDRAPCRMKTCSCPDYGRMLSDQRGRGPLNSLRRVIGL